VDKGRVWEKQHDWVAASEVYSKALPAILEGNEFYEAANIAERIGFCYHRAAMQADDPGEFKVRMVQATEAYQKAAKLFGKGKDSAKSAGKNHCEAEAAYTSSWLEPDLGARRRLLEDCWTLEKEALGYYNEVEDQLNLGKTCNELSLVQIDRLMLEWDGQQRKQLLEEALTHGEKAIATLSEKGDDAERWRAYYTTAILYYNGALGLELEKVRQYEEKSLSYSEMAVELAEKIGDPLLLGLSKIWSGTTLLDLRARGDLAEEHFEEALQCGVKTRDNYVVGRASYLLAFVTAWKIVSEEDPENIKAESEKWQKYCTDAINHYTVISNDQEIAQSYCWLAENYIVSATQTHVTDATSKKRHALLEKSIETGRTGLDHARRSGSPRAIWSTLHTLSKSLFLLSTLETKVEAKKRLLEESLSLREESIKMLTQAMPYFLWNYGVWYSYLALIQAELAEIEGGEKRRIELLEAAVTSAENCINLFSKHRILSRGQHAALGGYYSDYGGILNQLYALTGNAETLSKTVEAFSGAVETYQTADLPSRVAESFWQLAKVHSKLQNYAESAENFKFAAKAYKAVAKKLPQLKTFYSEYATYMQAWSEIENAKRTHAREEYHHAREHYKKAARLHKSTKLWRYLAPNYSAWVQLEDGEALSRNEQSQTAIRSFKKAAELFTKAKLSLEGEISRIQDLDEREMALELQNASDIRRGYCLGRIALEEAKILDRQGDHSSSSKRYGLAAETFEKVAAKMEPEQDRREFQPIIFLCKAWQRMMMAEAKTSSSLYMEAAELFKKAKEHGSNEKAKVLALGHSHFCKGLEAGTRFEDTLDASLYATATRHLESAANYYVKAGFPTASEYAKASKRLFAAYLYVDTAQTETDPVKKTQDYQMAEKMLQASAASYMKAQHTKKNEEVERLLESIREEQQLATSLTEVLHAPEVTSTTSSFSTPIPTHEEAVGLEKFEHANIQASLIVQDEEYMVGEVVTLDLEIVNAGRGPAILEKADNIIPATGFKILGITETYHVKDGCLIFQGKRLDPSKTVDVKIVIKPLTRGVFPMKPRIIYYDETGKSKSHEPDPVTLTVKELGISGWIRGEG